ncbi:MAG: cyclic nucleotide-binding domain-containing protein [Elusimicrobia bacterium]|nr:cyclic nucleotide-binding domain-containing protein [Elusimicrobiota bacterium]
MKIEKLEIKAEQLEWLSKILSKFNFFANLNIRQINDILAYISLIAYPKDFVLFEEGQKGDAMYIVYQGRIVINKKAGFFKFAKEISRLGPGEIFGEMALLNSAPRSATAKAAEDSKVFVLLSGDFEFVMEKNPEIAQQMRRLQEQRQFIASQIIK